MAPKIRQNQRPLFATENEALQNPPRVYNGKPLSRKVLRAAWDTVFHKTEPYYCRSRQLVDGELSL